MRNLGKIEKIAFASLQAYYARAAALCFRIRTLFFELVHVHQLHLVAIVSMSDLDGPCVCNLIHSSPAHLSHFTSCCIPQSATAVSIAVLRMISLAGSLGSAHNAGESANEDDADRGKASADDPDIDFDVGPVDNVELVPCWICGGGEANE